MSGYRANLGTLDETTATSYEARLKHLWMMAEQLRPVGELLQSFGPLAPPCVAKPYMQMRGKLTSASSLLLAAVKVLGSEAQFAEFEKLAGGGAPLGDERTVGPIYSIRSLPFLTVYWKDAPQQWQSFGGSGGGGTVAPGPGKLGDVETEAFDLMDLSGKAKSPSPGMLARARVVAGRIWNSKWVRTPTKFLGRWLGRGFLVMVAWDIGSRIYGAIWGDDPPPDVQAKVDEAVAFFNNDYLPEIAQQLQGMLLASASAGSNPAKLQSAMRAIDPWKLRPLPVLGPEGDEGAWKDLVTLKRRGNIWAVLGVFVGGSALDLAIARNG